MSGTRAWFRHLSPAYLCRAPGTRSLGAPATRLAPPRGETWPDAARSTTPLARAKCAATGGGGVQLSLSRLSHWLPRGQTHPEVVQGTAEFHHQITDPLLPQADPVLHDATPLDAAVDMLDP